MFIEPGVVDHFGGLDGQGCQQFLVLGAEGLGPIGVHVEHAAHLAIDFQRHGQLGADLGPDHDVARVAGDVADAGGPAGAGDPAGDAFAQTQFEIPGLGGQTFGSVDFEQAVGGIQENGGAAGGAHKPDRFVQDQLEGLLRIERGMNDVADLVEEIQPVVAGLQLS